MALLQPFDVMDNGGCAGLNPAVVTVNGGVLADFAVGEAAGLLPGGEQFNIIAQRALIAL